MSESDQHSKRIWVMSEKPTFALIISSEMAALRPLRTSLGRYKGSHAAGRGML